MFERTLYRPDMIRCALCLDAPCSRACGKIDVASMLRSIWFDDEKAAASRFPEKNPCIGCPAPCEAACRLGEIGESLSIRAIERSALRRGAARTGRGMLKFKKKKI